MKYDKKLREQLASKDEEIKQLKREMKALEERENKEGSEY